MMMKYQKGSRVEVLRSRDRAVESWRAGEIIGGNGSFYIVRFDGSACCGASPLVQAVRPGSIRPCPPAVKVPKLRCGDVVEVLVDFGWQTATFSKVMRNRYVWVKLGGCDKIRVRKGDVRIKQSWLNGEWVADKQISPRPTSAQGKKTSAINWMCESEIMQTKEQTGLKGPDDRTAAKKTNNRAYHAKLKRKSLCDINPDPCIEVTRKSRATEKDGLVVRAPALTKSLMAAEPGTTYLSPETQKLAKTSSFWNKLWFSKANAVEDVISNTDTTQSSVGSCSIFSNGIHFVHHHTHRPKCSEQLVGYASDAESFCGQHPEEKNDIQHLEKALLAEVQRCKAVRSSVHPCGLFLKLVLVLAAHAIPFLRRLH